MEIKKYDVSLSVCQVEDFSGINVDEHFIFTGRTDDELSLVCPTVFVPSNTISRDDGWKMMRIQGVLDFSLIGILAGISSVLADNGISIFAISTYNTDYILIKAENFEKALSILEGEGYTVV